MMKRHPIMKRHYPTSPMKRRHTAATMKAIRIKAWWPTRATPIITRLPQNPLPAARAYNASSTARWIKKYRTITNGFAEALRDHSRRRAIWICPYCQQINHHKEMDEAGFNWCGWCGNASDYQNILLGRTR